VNLDRAAFLSLLKGLNQMSSIQKGNFKKVSLSLKDMVGQDYTRSLCAARAQLSGEDEKCLLTFAGEKVDFFPKTFQQNLVSRLSQVGQVCCPSLNKSAGGASTREFNSHTNVDYAPLSGYGYYRIAENGRLYLISKSEHYHAPLGHDFPGYRLLERARRFGIPNATHNNTRGHITRRLEEELVRIAAGIPVNDTSGMNRILASKSRTVLNRVLNLETGSLAVEAALKLILARFYRSQDVSLPPKYQGRIPVIVVIGDDQGDLQANYHGTTVLTQVMRGMWPDFLAKLEKNKSLLIRAVRPNTIEDLESIFETYEQGSYKIAGVFHELVMMNYGALRLTVPFIRRLYSLCNKHDVPTVVDEIQSCIWSPEMFMFREYGIKPSMVAVGKGFPGGEYPASKILFSSVMDALPQFGALVTNGQEEISSLAYLITMRWAEANAEMIQSVGDYYEECLNELATDYPGFIHGIEGKRHLSGMIFKDLPTAKQFTHQLNEKGFDISVQTYKEGCPPVALTKLPLIMDYDVIDFIIRTMKDVLITI
jgi:acetylornithine/succinyldiaminopimelate/putrescine aminotransferase